jgi:hypothetical protein
LYIWNPTYTTSSGGGYASYVNGVGTGTPIIGTPYISSWQGFFVKANAASPLIHIKETHKVSNNAGSSFFKGNTAKANCLHMKLYKDATAFDDASVYMESEATLNFDIKYDAYDLTDGLGFLTSDGLNTLSISGLPLSTDPQKVIVSAKLSSGNYSFTFEDLNSFTSGTQVYLIDKYLNKKNQLNNNDTYTFNVNESNPFTFGINRFELLFANASSNIETVFVNENDMLIFPNPVKDLLTINTNRMLDNVSWTINNINGQVIKTGNDNMKVFAINTSDLTSGVYFIQVKSEGNTQVKRFIK